MELSLLEKFVLLAQHPTKRRFLTSEIQLHNGLIGALLMDLSLHGNLMIIRDELVVKKGNGIEHPMAAEVAAEIVKSPKNRKLSYWINHLVKKAPHYKRFVINQLAEKGILQVENKRFLGIFRYQKSKLINSDVRKRLVASARHQILYPDRDNINEETVMTGLIAASKLHHAITRGTAEKLMIQSKLKDILKHSPLGGKIHQSINQVQSAMLFSIVSSSAAGTTTTS